MNKNYRCILCGQEKNGIPVKADYIINSIRWFKRNVTKNEKHYTLVVCKDDYKKYYKARSSFIRKQVGYVALGIIFTVMLAITSRGNLTGIFVGVIITLFLYFMSLLSYMPPLALPHGYDAAAK